MERAETGRGCIGAGIDGSDKEVGESEGFKEAELARGRQTGRDEECWISLHIVSGTAIINLWGGLLNWCNHNFPTPSSSSS